MSQLKKGYTTVVQQRGIYRERFKSVTYKHGLRARIALWENMRCRLQFLFNIYRERIYMYYRLVNKSIIEEGMNLSRLVRDKAGIMDLEKTVHIEFPVTHYITRALLPTLSMHISRVSTHIKYLRRYIRVPND